MRTDRRTDEGQRSYRSNFSIAVAIAAAIILHGCGRGTQPAVLHPQADAEASIATTKTADESDSPEAAEGSAPLPPKQSAAESATPAESRQQLYAQHCAACHGERGDGQGIAAAFLFPKPRDFRAGRFRLTSTNNSIPTREDLHAVLLRGMPGSSMPPWAHLPQADRDALVDEILRFRADGARESFINQLKVDEGLTDEEIAATEVQQAIQDFVKNATTPGDGTPVPQIVAPSEGAIARGKAIYARFACVSCHGETGRGDGVQQMFDDEKMPTSPRDFTLGIFKGNPDPTSVYRRIAFGMPGTPMPGSTTMTPEQMIDLVHYIRSLSTEEQRQAATLNREKLVAVRVARIPGSEQVDEWSSIKPVQLRMAPLWWRQDVVPGLAVQAVHDGKMIGVRLSWQDASNDQHALRSESFEDAVAMELYHGGAEPFLGMGGPASPVDVWFWDADRQSGEITAEESYPNTVVDQYPFSEAVVQGPELSRTGARMADQPDISLPARASGNQIVPKSDESGGTALHVGGPRTVTFRVPQSQLVRATGTWKDGRWTVVMTRALSVPSPDDGISLDPGARASVAFAVWDGIRQDRDGQKLITIWQDLEIEP